jgi:hypothetical protein
MVCRDGAARPGRKAALCSEARFFNAIFDAIPLDTPAIGVTIKAAM